VIEVNRIKFRIPDKNQRNPSRRSNRLGRLRMGEEKSPPWSELEQKMPREKDK
jgi:hypothetical protein